MADTDHTTNFLVAEHFLAYFINGDMTAFDDADEKLMLAFEERETAGLTNFHWSYETDESGDFGRCEITGLRADRATLQLVNMDTMLAEVAEKGEV